MAQTIIGMFHKAIEAGGDKVAYVHRDASGDWARTSFAELGRRVEAVGEGLMALGVQPGDRVAILSNSRVEWALADYAILGCGGVVVPIYQTNSPAECEHVLRDSGASVVVVEDAAQLAKAHEVRDALPDLRHVVVIDEQGVDLSATEGDLLTLADVEAQGAATLEHRWRAAHADLDSTALATMIYTSGTTGPPKGCMLTHGNYAAMTEMVVGRDLRLFQGGDRVVLFLPLAHTFARLISFATLRVNIELGFSTVPTLMDDLAELKPTILPSVPRVFEKAHTRIQGVLGEATGVKAMLVAGALKAGRLRGRYLMRGRRVPPVLALRYAFFERLVLKKIHARFGGELRICISGGAPLGREVQEFFLAAGIVILEGYGLTESTTAVSLNRPDSFRIGSVGQALPGCTLRVADDGELLVQGPNVFQGYFGNEEATREVLSDDGWLHTGDIAALDKDGFLYITDRKKDIIVTAGGKNVAPQNVENALKGTRYVSQALVYGDRRPYLTALITLDPDEIATFASERGLPTDMRELVATDEVKQLVSDAVANVNADLGRVEQVKRFRILPVDFTQESGELTPTLKLKRKVVCERYQSYIDAMYEPDAPDCEGVTDDVAQLQTPVEV